MGGPPREALDSEAAAAAEEIQDTQRGQGAGLCQFRAKPIEDPDLDAVEDRAGRTAGRCDE